MPGIDLPHEFEHAGNVVAIRRRQQLTAGQIFVVAVVEFAQELVLVVFDRFLHVRVGLGIGIERPGLIQQFLGVGVVVLAGADVELGFDGTLEIAEDGIACFVEHAFLVVVFHVGQFTQLGLNHAGIMAVDLGNNLVDVTPVHVIAEWRNSDRYDNQDDRAADNERVLER